MVCDTLDCVVLSDQDGLSCIYPATVYCIGQPSERAAGLRQCEISPWFDSMACLDDWCRQYRVQLDAMAESESLYLLDLAGRKVEL